MRTEAEESNEIMRVSGAIADAVGSLGQVEAVDVIQASLATIVVMAEKLGNEPREIMAHLLLAVCDNDAGRARESLHVAAAERGIDDAEVTR